MTGKESRSRGLYRLEGLTREVTARGESLDEERTRFERLKGAEAPRVVVADQLFQTPTAIAAQMCQWARSIGPGFADSTAVRLLEPSAGLGRLVRESRVWFDHSRIVAVDVAPQCVSELQRIRTHSYEPICADFLELSPADLGVFEIIIMNPPFRRGEDVKHIFHARQFLAPRGVLVGLCYAGAKQGKELLPDAYHWEPLPANSFRESGTNADVNLVIFKGPKS